MGMNAEAVLVGEPRHARKNASSQWCGMVGASARRT